MNHKQQATMVTIEGRPTPVLHKLNGIDDVLVQCRHINGEDVYVPLREIFDLLANELANIWETKKGDNTNG